jgi:hypothetical protein
MTFRAYAAANHKEEKSVSVNRTHQVVLVPVDYLAVICPSRCR